MSKVSFSCIRCGHCCHGKGGIIVGANDLIRLCKYFQIDAKEFLDKYAENYNGKQRLIMGENGFCYFFKENVGCDIHDARPNVCRAWPYFRGNLIDEVSFGMAKVDCQGINQDISHTEFAHEGFSYLKEYELLASDKQQDSHALIVSDDELPKKS